MGNPLIWALLRYSEIVGNGGVLAGSVRPIRPGLEHEPDQELVVVRRLAGRHPAGGVFVTTHCRSYWQRPTGNAQARIALEQLCRGYWYPSMLTCSARLFAKG